MKRKLLYAGLWLVFPVLAVGIWYLIWLMSQVAMLPPPAYAQGRDTIQICHAVPVTAETEEDIVQWLELSVDDDGWNGHAGHPWDFQIDEDNACPPQENGDEPTPTPEPTQTPDPEPTPTDEPEPTETQSDTPTQQDVACPLGYELTVVARMRDFAPIPGVEVLVQRGEESFIVTTSEDGTVTFPASWGLYRFTVLTAPQFSWRDAVLETTLGPGSEDDRGICWDDVVFIDPPEEDPWLNLQNAGLALAVAWGIVVIAWATLTHKEE